MGRIEILKMILTDLKDAKEIFELLDKNSVLKGALKSSFA
jgi:hypothetical protein